MTRYEFGVVVRVEASQSVKVSLQSRQFELKLASVKPTSKYMTHTLVYSVKFSSVEGSFSALFEDGAILRRYYPDRPTKLGWFEDMRKILAHTHDLSVIVANICLTESPPYDSFYVTFSNFTKSTITSIETDMGTVDDNSDPIYTDIGWLSTVMYEIITGRYYDFDLLKTNHPAQPGLSSRERRPSKHSQSLTWCVPLSHCRVNGRWIERLFECLSVMRESRIPSPNSGSKDLRIQYLQLTCLSTRVPAVAVLAVLAFATLSHVTILIHLFWTPIIYDIILVAHETLTYPFILASIFLLHFLAFIVALSFNYPAHEDFTTSTSLDALTLDTESLVQPNATRYYNSELSTLKDRRDLTHPSGRSHPPDNMLSHLCIVLKLGISMLEVCVMGVTPTYTLLLFLHSHSNAIHSRPTITLNPNTYGANMHYALII
ncbi:uncharacterized protein BDR25DRAFT_362898 [Lindgomyces ingoldianus]|uniref:Uncharacterized protein n=1 Tax=Lindgomyces ingoldianus TaxID=673940 RepID=A0ACB6Q8S3_9PLEO|nr:uncharacterized protein BDR25DRAFT_362898 [Lindgomyces ingoldianus]KAF2463353.1 hypothetical protein BDR25DRAFT_362898 [Lindgomyces ingoldianus]